jgi:hypothetical protein
MPTFRLPLSGDVAQTINPWTWALRWAGNQFGLININLGRSSDPDTEQRIIDEVGSYGRQLGRIGDALGVLIKHVKLDDLTQEETVALLLLQEQLKEIDRIKQRGRLIEAQRL